MKQSVVVLVVFLAALLGSSLARPNGDQEAAIAAADQELMAQESTSSARSLDSTDFDKTTGLTKYPELGPKFIKYKGMKCLVEDPLPAPASLNKRSLEETRRAANSLSSSAAAESSSASGSDTSSNLFNIKSLLSAMSDGSKNTGMGSLASGFGGITTGLDGFPDLGALSGAFGGGGLSGKAKGKGKNSLVRFNFMKRILELIGLFVKVATDEKFLKDGNFLDFIKLCRETLIGFDKLDR